MNISYQFLFSIHLNQVDLPWLVPTPKLYAVKFSHRSERSIQADR